MEMSSCNDHYLNINTAMWARGEIGKRWWWGTGSAHQVLLGSRLLKMDGVSLHKIQGSNTASKKKNTGSLKETFSSNSWRTKNTEFQSDGRSLVGFLTGLNGTNWIGLAIIDAPVQ